MVIIQKRDLDIFRWGLEMRFMDLGVIADRFFDVKSSHRAGVRKRVLNLNNNGYLKKVSGFDGTTRAYYLVTTKAYNAVKESEPEAVLSRPVRELRPAHFQHDLKVSYCRVALEKSGRATNWRSERFLKAMSSEAGKIIPKAFIPDAVFDSKIGVRCAFELENSHKSRKRYADKIDRFVEIIERKDSLFGLCLFVVPSDYIYKILTELTAPYGNRFRVQKYGEIVENGK